MSTVSAWTGLMLRALIRAYQLVVSPLFGPSCRFAPSCSSYAMEAIARHGPLHGSRLALQRVARCHPWNAGGYDPVPDHAPPGGAAQQ
jgi:putative membrane protein insertion efficiency factor